MNLVDMIKDQLTGAVLNKLSASIGESEEKTKAAASVAIPSLLSALSSLASNSQGAETLINSLRHFDDDSLNRLKTDLTQDDAGKVRDRGGDILGSLLGGNLPALINVLSKFSGIGADALKSLLSYLAPLILSMIAAQMKGKNMTPAGLGGFFDDQKSNIQAALPAGFSLASTPAPQASPSAAASGMPGWLLPLAALVLLGIAAWYFLGSQPDIQPGGMEPPVVTDPAAVPDPTPTTIPAPTPAEPKAPVDPNAPIPTADEVTKSLDEVFTTATQTLTSVKDAETAEAAVPKLEGLTAKIDSIKALWERLPAFPKATVTKATSERLSNFKTLVGKTLELPGVGDKLKPVLDALVAKLAPFVSNVSSST